MVHKSLLWTEQKYVGMVGGTNVKVLLQRNVRFKATKKDHATEDEYVDN